MQFASRTATLPNLAIISLHFVIASNFNTELHQTPFILRSYRVLSGNMRPHIVSKIKSNIML